jgi:hypothetical protein
MSTSKIFFVLFVFVGLLLASCSDEQQSPVSPTDQGSLGKVIIRDFTGTDYPTALIDPGTTTEHNGIMKIRDMHQSIAFEVIFSDGGVDLLSGNGDLELNANIDWNNGTAFWWGSKTLTPTSPEAQGGQFKFNWHGPATLDVSGWTLTLQEVGHGDGGALTGIQCFLDNIVSALPDLSDWTGAMDGYLKTH